MSIRNVTVAKARKEIAVGGNYVFLFYSHPVECIECHENLTPIPTNRDGVRRYFHRINPRCIYSETTWEQEGTPTPLRCAEL